MATEGTLSSDGSAASSSGRFLDGEKEKSSLRLLVDEEPPGSPRGGQDTVGEVTGGLIERVLGNFFGTDESGEPEGLSGEEEAALGVKKREITCCRFIPLLSSLAQGIISCYGQ